MSKDEGGPMVKLYCPKCGFRTERPEDYMPAYALSCGKCGGFMQKEDA